MNSYNENLQASVVASLASQELQEKTIKSAANASMFTLYYAEGATITANDNLTAAKDNQDFTGQVQSQAVHSSNICNNLLASATQANQYIQQSVSNAAVCASNVQIAANAILKLAGDMGSIYSIIHAANADTEIDTLAGQALSYMNTTATKAEEASKLAMDASIKTAEVTAAIVFNKAQSTTNAMNNVLQIANTNFSNATQTVTTASTALAQVYANEKMAEGDFKDKSIDFISTKSAYKLTNAKLNQDLKAYAVNQNTFTFWFNLLQSPFAPNNLEANYPVANYYAFVVPNSDKTTFAIANAENILLTQPNRFIPISFKTVNSLGTPTTTNGITTYPLMPSEYGQTAKLDFNYSESQITDVNGKPITTGTSYVIFIMAEYYPDYKKAVNCYDDYLSAPSWPFVMRNQLTAVDTANISVPGSVTKNASKQTSTTETTTTDSYAVNFNVAENSNFSPNVEYRCILLPQTSLQTKSLLNTASFEAFEQEVENLEKIADQYDPLIASLQAQIAQATAQMMNAQTTDTTSKQSAKTSKNSKKQSEKQTTTSTTPVVDIVGLQSQLTSAINQKQNAITSIKTSAQSNIDFIFNLTIAEQVLAGNYTVATPATPPTTTSKSATQKGNDTNTNPTTYWTAPILDATTDNFGNPLIDGDTYLAVILSISTVSEENLPMFSNAWSGYVNAPSFTYKTQPLH